ncbi:MAG: hypothetical protein Q8R29_01785 [bacterium]|jgi:hypothetical protein|nr:hypothetical protein [bacterium]
MSYLYQDDFTSAKDDDTLSPATDDVDEEGPMVPEEDFEEKEDEENGTDSY